MFRNQNRYAKTIVLGNELLHDTKNTFRFVSQKPYKGKPEKNLEAGVSVCLQVMYDISEPVIDKNTGVVQDNNVFETFDATIIGVSYPLPFKKGDYVALEGFMEEASYYIDYKLILRFKGIKQLKSATQNQQGGSVNATAR